VDERYSRCRKILGVGLLFLFLYSYLIGFFSVLLRDWTLHSTPATAHPSYRLITALRLYHIFSDGVNTLPADSDHMVDMWRDVTLGKRDTISQENESRWRLTLERLCNNMIQDAKRGLIKVRDIQVDQGNGWVEFAKVSIEMLWREEMDVGCAVLRKVRISEHQP
jgi:hypothetical protein